MLKQVSVPSKPKLCFAGLISSVFFTKPFLSQTFSLTLNQMHVVFFSESVFHVENLLYPSDMSFSAFYVLSSVCWPPGGPQDFET